MNQILARVSTELDSQQPRLLLLDGNVHPHLGLHIVVQANRYRVKTQLLERMFQLDLAAVDRDTGSFQLVRDVG